ncbi:MAG: hypothetical protein ACPHQP_00705 [Longimicrobiales bacterium]
MTMELTVTGSNDETTPRLGSQLPVRHFGDDEVTRILHTAAELQERSADHGSQATGGLTLEELRQVAVEAGIDPRFVDQAATQEAAPLHGQGERWAGAPYKWEVQASVPGEIQDADRERILYAIRSVMGQKGELDYVFGRMEWSYNDGVGPIIIGLSSRDGRTEATVHAARLQEAQFLHGLGVPFTSIFGGAILAKVLGLSGLVVLPLMGTLSLVSFGVIRMGWKARARWWERKVRDVLDRIMTIVREVAVVPPSEEDPSRLGPGSSADRA